MMEAQLGRPLGEVFSSISERPVAAASLGQVYKAVLRETGQEVAIKVQGGSGSQILKCTSLGQGSREVLKGMGREVAITVAGNCRSCGIKFLESGVSESGQV